MKIKSTHFICEFDFDIQLDFINTKKHHSLYLSQNKTKNL